MLATQVQYWNYLENQRHNMATEKQAQAELSETQRSNLVREAVSRGTLDEGVRHNKAQEQVSWGNLQEVSRHNVQQEQIGFSNVNELTRHNQEQEKLLPYQQDKYQMETTTGYVDTSVNAGDKLGRGLGPIPKTLVASAALAGMLGASDVSHGSKGGPTYGHFSAKGTNYPRTQPKSHYGGRPTLSDADRNKFTKY